MTGDDSGLCLHEEAHFGYLYCLGSLWPAIVGEIGVTVVLIERLGGKRKVDVI